MAVRTPDIKASEKALDDLMQRCDGVAAVMLALRDGRPFVERMRNGVDTGRFAAMVSSLVALGHSVLKELNSGMLDHVLIEGTEGKLVITAVPGTGGLLQLAVQAERDARPGLVLGQSKICAAAVGRAMPAGKK